MTYALAIQNKYSKCSNKLTIQDSWLIWSHRMILPQNALQKANCEEWNSLSHFNRVNWKRRKTISARVDNFGRRSFCSGKAWNVHAKLEAQRRMEFQCDEIRSGCHTRQSLWNDLKSVCTPESQIFRLLPLSSEMESHWLLWRIERGLNRKILLLQPSIHIYLAIYHEKLGVTIKMSNDILTDTFDINKLGIFHEACSVGYLYL